MISNTQMAQIMSQAMHEPKNDNDGVEHMPAVAQIRARARGDQTEGNNFGHHFKDEDAQQDIVDSVQNIQSGRVVKQLVLQNQSHAVQLKVQMKTKRKFNIPNQMKINSKHFQTYIHRNKTRVDEQWLLYQNGKEDEVGEVRRSGETNANHTKRIGDGKDAKRCIIA